MDKKIIAIKKSIYILFIVAILYIILGNLAAKNIGLYNLVRYNNFVVLTGSMEPEIFPGDFITIRKCNVNKLKKDDIITFKLNGEYITHRIQSVNGDKIITKGDANNIEDDPIYKSNVIGKYLWCIPKFGYLISFFSSLSGIILIVGSIIIILFLDITSNDRKKRKMVHISKAEYKEFLEYRNKFIEEKVNHSKQGHKLEEFFVPLTKRRTNRKKGNKKNL